MDITLDAYKNDTISFVTEALVPIKLPFVTQNTHIYISEMKNGHLMARKSSSDFRQKSIAFCSEHHFLNLQQRHLKFCHLSFGTDKATICYAKYIHTHI